MKKGFTLIELLAVIVILAVIASITLVSVKNLISSSRKSLSKTQIANIEEAAKNYYLNEGMDRDVECVELKYLLSENYIKSDNLKNMINDHKLDGSVLIKSEAGNYSYKFQKSNCE